MHPAYAKEIWLLTPGFHFSRDEKEKLEEKIQETLKKNQRDGFVVKIIPNSTQGYALSYYLQLRSSEAKSWPDYVVYYQPARFLSYDLQEMMLSDLDET